MREDRLLKKYHKILDKVHKPSKEELVAIFTDLKNDLTKWRSKK